MLYFTADLHFYHENIIRHANRPYYNIEKMNDDLIKRWNKIVSSQDEIYILGDFTMKGAKRATDILCQLKGIKHLVKGNHDGFVEDSEFDRTLFASIQDYAEVISGNTRFVLFHYPILEWNGMYKGSILLHGHQHNHVDYNYNNLQNGIYRFDVGIDANNMTPVSAEDILSFFYLP